MKRMFKKDSGKKMENTDTQGANQHSAEITPYTHAHTDRDTHRHTHTEGEGRTAVVKVLLNIFL